MYITQPPEPVIPPLPVWPAITTLQVGKDGRIQQSNQIPEVQACLRAAVRRANANLALVDGFPDLHRRGAWLSQALGTELNRRRNESTSMEAIADRALFDQQYFNSLLHMVNRFVTAYCVPMTAKKSYPRFTADGVHSGRESWIWREHLSSPPSHHTASMSQMLLISIRYALWRTIFYSRTRIILVKLQQ